MPTPIPTPEKDAFIALVQAAPYPGGANEADRLQTILVNYEDIFTAVMRQILLFAANNAYLTQAMSVFNDNELLAVGIWNEKTTVMSPPLTDPILIVNCQFEDTVYLINLNSPPFYKVLAILGDSTLKLLEVVAGSVINELYIGPGSEVSFFDASSAGTVVSTVWLPFLKNTPSRLLAVAAGSVINNLKIEDGSFFGGYTNDTPAATCATPVTDLATPTITTESVQLTWVPPSHQSPPSAYLFIHIYYREKGSNEWITATESTGIFNGETGYTFNQLKEGTKYEFQVIVVCNNGGHSAPAEIEAETTCC